MSTIFSSNNILSTLTAGAVNSSLQAAQIRFDSVQKAIQNQYLAEIKKVQENPTQSSDDLLKKQIDTLSKQKSSFNNFQKQYGTNVAMFGDLAKQLSALEDAIEAGDATAFDASLNNASTDVANLTVVQQMPQFQPDNVLSFKVNGLGIQSAASYDLTTDEGKEAALAVVRQAEAKVGQSIQLTTLNQTVAGQIAKALDQRISSLNGDVQQHQLDQIKKTTEAVQTLQKKAATQLHLIQLAFANSQQLSQSLLSRQFASLDNKPGTIFSIFR